MWTDNNNGKNNIFMRDIAKHKTTQIEKSGTASTATSPAIYCNRIRTYADQVYANLKSFKDNYLNP